MFRCEKITESSPFPFPETCDSQEVAAQTTPKDPIPRGSEMTPLGRRMSPEDFCLAKAPKGKRVTKTTTTTNWRFQDPWIGLLFLLMRKM